MKKRKPARPATHYTLVHEISASPTEPLPQQWRTHQLTRMHSGLEALERGDQPGAEDWRVLSDAVNLMETLIQMGEVQDPGGLQRDAMEALAYSGKRYLEGKPMRLDARGMQAVRGLLEDYGSAIDALPARTMVRAHRLTEVRVQDILAGRRQPHDVEIVTA